MKTKNLIFLMIIAAGVMFPPVCYSQESGTAECNGHDNAPRGNAAGSNKALLYRISGGGLEKPSYIFGTHHMAPLTVLEGIEGFESAFAASDAVVGELLMSDMQLLQQAMMPHMMLPEGTTYSDLLSAEDYAVLDEGLARDLGAGLSQFGGFHPGALNMIYSVSLYAKHIPGYNPSQTSLDQHFQLRAAEEGKTVIGLETVEDQINAAFYSEPVEVIAQSLVELVRNPDYTVNLVGEVTKYYMEQDLEKLYEVSFENPDNPFEMEGMEKALLKERNDRWMEQLPKLMAEQPVFVAVGAGHLPGPDGILTQLRAAGYIVEEIK